MNFRSEARAWARSQRQTHAGELITITRGETSIEVTAVRARQPLTVDPSAAVTPPIPVRSVHDQDWLITATDYDFGAGPVLPAIGDTITDSEDVTYQVLPIDGRNDCWLPRDPDGEEIRVHSKR